MELYFHTTKQPTKRHFKTGGGPWRLPNDVKQRIGEGLAAGKFTAKQLVDKYDLPYNLISKIKTQFNGGLGFHASGGRPAYFPKALVTSLAKGVKEADYKPLVGKLRTTAVDEANAWRAGFNMPPLANVSTSSFRRLP